MRISEAEFKFVYYYPEFNLLTLQSYKSHPKIDKKYGCFYIGEL